MHIIYETTGRAREYSELAVNLYQGCAHACYYCYAPGALHTDRAKFNLLPRLRGDNTMDLIERDARDLQARGDTRPVLLCFTCDPYQPLNDEHGLARQAIEVLHRCGVPVMILTKGGKRAEQDFDLLGPGDMFGVTLTLVDDAQSRRWEPGAALPQERIVSLINAHDRGIKTWVSLEPIISYDQTVWLIRLTAPVVDHYKVGKMNHMPGADLHDWKAIAEGVKQVLDDLGADYYIKKDLAKYLEPAAVGGGRGE